MRTFQKILIALAITAVSVSLIGLNTASPALQDGDIVFQTSKGEFGRAIQIATGSVFSHVGVVFHEKGKPMVLEAVQPVRAIPFDQWVGNGSKRHYVVKRLKKSNSVLTSEVLNSMRTLGKSWLGKDYDSQFNWTDQDMYCSELVWKLYERGTGLELGTLAALDSYQLDDPLVRKRLEMHYGKQIPWKREIISPQAMFDSPLLRTVDQSMKKSTSIR